MVNARERGLQLQEVEAGFDVVSLEWRLQQVRGSFALLLDLAATTMADAETLAAIVVWVKQCPVSRNLSSEVAQHISLQLAPPSVEFGMPRTVLISGASRGIGRAIAERLLAQGHRLSLGLRRPADLQGTALDHPKVLLHPYEASEPETAQVWVDASVASFGGIDTVVHCAGVFSRVPLLFEADQQAEIEQHWQVNVMGPWWLTRAAWPQLAADGQGRVVVLVSMSGKRSKGRLAGYTASKFALMGLCQTMRNEGWEQGIRVTAICPSWVNTDMAAAVQAMPAEAMTQPGDIAALTAQLLELPNSCVPFELAVSCNLEM